MDRQKKDLKLRVIKGGRPNEVRSGNDAVEFLKEKTEKENEFRAEELALETTPTTRSCQTGSDFSYNAVAATTITDKCFF